MLEFIYIACLLLANVHPSQLDQEDSEENEGDFPSTVSPCSEYVSQPTIDSPSQEATIGWNVTLECLSQHGSPPINYTLYKGKQKMPGTVIRDKPGEKALFNFVINSDDELGEYKCKVENKCENSTKYSSGFNFKDFPSTVSPCSEYVSQPTIDSPSQEATIGWNVTLECLSQHGSPPINYTLYKGKQKMPGTVIRDKPGEKALFNFVINSDDELGEYKCKVENKCENSTKYSSGFNFKVPKDNVMMFIVAPLLVIVLAVIILLLVLWCRARKSKPTTSHTGSGSTGNQPPHILVLGQASENCTTYEKIAYENEDVAYTEVKFYTKDEDYRKMFVEVDNTVNYAEVAIRK